MTDSIAQSALADDNGEVLEHSDHLAVRYVPGSSRNLVISFRGLGGAKGGAGRVEEFWGSISQGGTNHMLFIADLAQSWYNHRGLMKRIRAYIQQILGRVQPVQVSAIGNSMGGYGAMIFSGFFPFDRVLAICPQATLDQDLVPDQRWARFARRTRVLRAPHVRDCVNPVTRYTVMLGARGLERAQAAQMPSEGNIRVFLMRGYYHAVAEGLKAQGLMRPLIHSFLNGEAFGLEHHIRGAGGILYNPQIQPQTAQ